MEKQVVSNDLWEAANGMILLLQEENAALKAKVAEITSTNSAMDAIRKAYIEGYGMGHHHTVESCYCPEQAADDWLSEQHQ